MPDLRSKYCVFVSHCMLAQCVMANGVVKRFPGSVKPVIQFCLDHDINMMQMPCPETLCEAGGLGREPRGKKWYENNGLRETSKAIAAGQAAYMRSIEDAGFIILAIIGIDFSPACAVNYLNKGRSVYRDQGIYMEELKIALDDQGLEMDFIGVCQRWEKKMRKDLEQMMAGAAVRERHPRQRPA